MKDLGKAGNALLNDLTKLQDRKTLVEYRTGSRD